jgi:hypothetical protein
LPRERYNRFAIKRCGIVLGLLCVAVLSGCEVSPGPRSIHHPPPADETYVLHFPGIAGRTALDANWVKALGAGGVADHLEMYDWNRPYTRIGALRAYAHNRAEAKVIAGKIANKLAADPHANIILTGWSGGCQMIVWALEDLPPQASVQSVVMIAPAITPTYDLSRALAHVRGSLFACTSPGDWFVLGWGTHWFGTSDGAHTNAAGMVGFSIPQGADMTQYRKLVQLRYAAAWRKYGNFGGHNGAISPAFAREILAPKLKEDARKNEIVN